MALPMGGVRVTQTDSYYWLIPSSPVMWLAFQPTKKKKKKSPAWELAFPYNVLREEEYVILRGFIPKLILNISELVIISPFFSHGRVFQSGIIIAVSFLPCHPDRLPFNRLAWRIELRICEV